MLEPQQKSIITPTEYRRQKQLETERGACGIGAIVNLQGEVNRQVMELGLSGLCDMDLRGGQIDGTGDGAGVMVRTQGLRPFFEQFIPDGTQVPKEEEIYAGMINIAWDERSNLPQILAEIETCMAEEGIHVAGWRTSEHTSSPSNSFEVDDKVLGEKARKTKPIIAQVLFTKGFQTQDTLRLALHNAKLRIAGKIKAVDVVSMENGTVGYKAMATGKQLRKFYKDFQDEQFKTDAILFHRRYATNVLSRWALAQLFRLIGHNGEINTIQALRAAGRDLKHALRMGEKLLMRGGSDSGDLDRIVDLYHSHDIPLSEVLRRLFQPTPDDQKMMSKEVQRYHRAVRLSHGPLSAAEGPAAIIFMDRDEVGGIMDGLGLRPFRAIETTDDLLILTSEIGAPFIPMNKIKRTFQFDAGEMIITKNRKVYYPGEADEEVAKNSDLNVDELAGGKVIFLPGTQTSREAKRREEICTKWNIFGGNTDLLDRVSVMAYKGKEPIIGMGNNEPLSVFSKAKKRFADFFHQIVAVVTNPPMDPIREGASMDVQTYIGRRPKASEHGHDYKPQEHIELKHPFLTEDNYQELLEAIPSHTIETIYEGGTALDIQRRIEQIKQEAVKIARSKKRSVIALSDRNIQEGQMYIPPALGAAAVHNELLRRGLRRNVSIVCDTGEAFEAHDLALLVAMGVDAVNPYLMWESIDAEVIKQDGTAKETLKENLMNTFVSTLKRIMSKMGITSIEGYRGSKLMEAVGIDPMLIQYYMGCPVANIGGMKLQDMVDEMMARSKQKGKIQKNPDEGGYDGSIMKLLQRISFYSSQNPKEAFQKFVAAVEAQDPVYIRDLLKIRTEEGRGISLEEIISESDLFKNHIRGAAMSHGALSLTAHRAIAGAFNELGGWSNSGEGGELPERNPGGKCEADQSKSRQRASALFGGEAEYFGQAEELVIKIGQGAKPGEGGHLPDFKVGPIIARMRKTQPGIDLISPPPLHDVYSIEDLARLIGDLRAINPTARISVKITANTDIGTISVGVAKAGADAIILSGWEGGTGAAASSAIDHTGLPLEISLAEVHQALTNNRIRDLVKIQVEGGIKTGRDIVKLACMGADEFGLGTALMIAGEGCIYCHSCSGQAKGVMAGTFTECPTGITAFTEMGQKKLGLGAKKAKTEELLKEEQSYEIAKKATIHYLRLLAEDLRETLAKMGKKNIEEIVGDTTLLEQIPRTKEADRVNLKALLHDVRGDVITAKNEAIAEKIDRNLKHPAINEANQELLEEVQKQNGKLQNRRLQIHIKQRLSISDRAFGTALAGEIVRNKITPPREGILIETEGYAGQSLGFCNIREIKIVHTGFANDFVGMASKGDIIIRQPSYLYQSSNSVAGNACGYGASDGKLYCGGKVGQRYGIRSCGGVQVAESTGKYAYEYKTGGIGVVLEKSGNQTGAGMTGGELFLRDADGTLLFRLHGDVMAVPWTGESKRKLVVILNDYKRETESSLAEKILKEDQLNSFVRIVPKDHFVNAVTSVLSYDFYSLDDTLPLEQIAENAAREIAAMLELNDEDPKVREALKKNLMEEKTNFENTAKQTEGPYRFQEAKEYAKKWCTQACERLNNKVDKVV